MIRRLEGTWVSLDGLCKCTFHSCASGEVSGPLFLQAVNPSTPYLCCAAGKQNQRIRHDKHVMPEGAQRRLRHTVPWSLGCGF